MLKNSIYTKNNGIFLTGDWRYLLYSQSTYGLGTTAPEGGILDYQYGLWGTETTDDSLSQPMKFNFARFHQSVSFRITEGLYAGVRILTMTVIPKLKIRNSAWYPVIQSLQAIIYTTHTTASVQQNTSHPL